MFMDRSYLLANGKPTLDKFEISVFHDYVFSNTHLQLQILNGALDGMQLHQERATGGLDLLRKSIALIHDLGVYHQIFEPRLLAKLQEDCVRWAAKAIQEMPLPTYVKTATFHMDTMVKTGEAAELDVSTRASIVTMMEHVLIYQHKDKLSLFFPPFPPSLILD